MLIVTQLPNSDLSIKSDYSYKDRIKKIPTAKFDYDTKQWVIKSFALGTLEQEFKGELVYKTPRWVILNQPLPDMSTMYQIHDKTIQSPSLKLKPYDYQDYGIRFMIDKILQENFVLNADDVGLGKTLQTIGTIKWFIENKNIHKILIICKKSIKKQWLDEINKFTDLNQTFVMEKTGTTPKQRKESYDKFNDAQNGILITNYHAFLNDTEFFKQMNIDFVVIDEVHSIKCRTGILNNNIASIVYNKPTIFLTGTPIMSKPEDIFGIIQMASPNYFGPWKDFSKEYLVYNYGGRFGAYIVGAKNLDKLRSLIQNIVIRRTEYEVSIQLPSTIINKIECQMDNTQEALLKKISENQNMILESIEKLKINGKIPDHNKNKAEQLEGQSKALIAAKQAASTDPRLFLLSNSKMMKDTYGNLLPKKYKMSSKTEAIIDLIEDIMSNNDKVILFTKFKTCAKLIADDIKNILKENVLLYTGAESDNIRETAIDYFKNTTTYNILIGTEAMAEGLNLQNAKYIINIDQPDTLAIKTQRIGRARRAGSQFDNVIIYDMITSSSTKAQSKDEERLENILNNQNITDALVSIDDAQRKALINAMKG